MFRSLRMLATGAALALVFGMTALVSPAGAVSLTCGQVITTNTTLGSDLGPCSNNGILIGANNITFNLNGHRIYGTPAAGDGAGVLVNGRTGVTVKGGTVTDFDGGVVLVGGSRNTIMQMNTHDNVGDVSEALFTEFGDGILLANSSGNRLIGNAATHNGPFDGIGLLGNSDNNYLQGNVAQQNNIPDARPGHESPSGNQQEDDGFRLETINASNSPDHNTFFGNTALSNGLDGMAIFPFAKDNVLDSNTISGNGLQGNIRPGDGIHVFGSAQRNIIKNNRVTGNARDGIVVDFTNPITFPSPLQNQVTRNIAVQNGAAPQSFPAYDLADLNQSCDGNVWTANTFGTKNFPGSDCIH